MHQNVNCIYVVIVSAMELYTVGIKPIKDAKGITYVRACLVERRS
jgi:hypothetical protein